MTGRSCMKVVGRLSELSPLMLSGKRSMRNGQRDQQRNFPSGLVRGQARKLVMLRLLRVRKRVVKKHQQTKKIMMKRKKKRRKRKRRKSKSYALDKSTFDLPNISGSFSSIRRTSFFLLLCFRFFKHWEEDHQHIPDMFSL